MCSVSTPPSMNRVKNVLRGENPARPKIKRGENDESTLNEPTFHPREQSFHITFPRGLQVPLSRSAKQTRQSKRIGR
jgi:hypothetical protein